MENEIKGLVQILLVEDDLNLSYLLQENLTAKGFSVSLARSGKAGLELAANTDFDICLLDIMLPEMDGFTLAQALRQKDATLPIIFLTARVQEKDKLHGFEIGADDYVTKPFSFKELYCRIIAVLRRVNFIAPTHTEIENLSLGSLVLYPSQRMLSVNGQQRKLSQRESGLLQMLLQHNGKYVNRSEILKKVWGNDDYFTAKSMDVYITRIRKLIKDDPSLEVENLYGTGYRIRQNN
jgi:DNA-binding response OmpR family regulator